MTNDIIKSCIFLLGPPDDRPRLGATRRNSPRLGSRDGLHRLSDLMPRGRRIAQISTTGTT